MKSKAKTGSQLSTSSTNKKKADEGKTKRFSSVFLKKNEFGVILLGALLLTMIIFFVFFRSSGPDPESAIQSATAPSFNALEKRIAALEATLATNKNVSAESNQTEMQSAISPLNDRVTRLETAFLVKFESLIERLESLEKKMTALKTTAVAPSTPAPPVKKAAAVKKTAPKVAKKEKKASMFHTVTKGETLYSISKKYKTTVAALKKLNNMTDKDKIYPGNNIIVR